MVGRKRSANGCREYSAANGESAVEEQRKELGANAELQIRNDQLRSGTINSPTVFKYAGGLGGWNRT